MSSSVERRVVRRHAEVRRALEDGDVLGLGGDLRDRLDAGRAGADHRHALAGEVDALVRPGAGVVGRAREASRRPGIAGARGVERQPVAMTSQRAETLVAAVGGHASSGRPPRRRSRDQHAGLEGDQRPQVEAVGDVVGVAQDLRLGGVLLAPAPLLLQLVGEGVGVVQARHVAARARIAVPVPGAADAVAGLEALHRDAELAQLVQHVHAAEPGPDHHRVDLAGSARARVQTRPPRFLSSHLRNSSRFRRETQAQVSPTAQPSCRDFRDPSSNRGRARLRSRGATAHSEPGARLGPARPGFRRGAVTVTAFRPSAST